MKVDIGQSSASAANKKQGHVESVGKYRENHICRVLEWTWDFGGSSDWVEVGGGRVVAYPSWN